MVGPASSSGEKSASSAIIVRPGYLHGFEVQPPYIGVATLKIYDNDVEAAGQIIASATVAAGQNSVYLNFMVPRILNKGIYAALTGTTTYTVAFSLG